MKVTWGFLLLGLVGHAATGAYAAGPDLTLMKDIVGRHSVLDRNGAFPVAGTVLIRADEKLVGISTEPLKLSSVPIPSENFLSSTESTTLRQEGNTIVQEGTNESGTLKISYYREDGYLSAQAEVCKAGACEKTTFTLTQGGSPGEALDPRGFFAGLKGSYVIELAGLQPPHAETNSAEVDTTTDPAEAAVYVPYCTPKGCDIGYQSFKYDSTRVFKRKVSEARVVYELFVKGKQLSHFSWDAEGARVTFRNFQYPLDPEVVCLEHVMKRSAELASLSHARS